MEAQTIRNLIRAEISRAFAMDRDSSASFVTVREGQKDAEMAYECLRTEDLQECESLYNRLRAVEEKVMSR